MRNREWAEREGARPFLVLLALVVIVGGCVADADAPSSTTTSPLPGGEGQGEGTPAPQGIALDIEAPDGMIGVPGGVTTIGLLASERGGMPHERPAFEAEVAPFLLDRSPVTVARFRRFVEATGFETQAEGFGDGAVMDPATGQWGLIPGADWRTPFGPNQAAAADDHPVTQVSWADAEAFCAYDGGRLPTEVEWEHAARGAANDRSAYAWGDALGDGAEAKANTWTGSFPANDTGADGFEGGTNPVGHFGETPLGLTDLGGNVWEWTASWYQPYPPSDTYAPTAGDQRVQRGGSFLCHPSYCHGYRVSARSHATPESSFAHVGFRCARDLS